MLKEAKKQLATAEADLAGANAKLERLKSRLAQIADDLQTAESSIASLTSARQTALRKAALDLGTVEIDRSALLKAQTQGEELREMAEVIREEIESTQNAMPLLANNVGTARRAFMAAICNDRIERFFGQLRRDDIIELHVIHMGAMGGGGNRTVAEIAEVLRRPLPEEINAAAARLKTELGFEPY